jgi:hypothetical protein
VKRGKQNSNLAVAVEEQAIRSLTAVDEGLTLMSTAYLRDGARLDAQGLFDVGSTPTAMVSNFGVIDELGRVVWSIAPFTVDSLDGGRFFQEHREQPVLETRIPVPAKSPQSGDWIILMSRRIAKRDGSFAGCRVHRGQPALLHAVLSSGGFRSRRTDLAGGPGRLWPGAPHRRHRDVR